jgi:hypothetical protein
LFTDIAHNVLLHSHSTNNNGQNAGETKGFGDEIGLKNTKINKKKINIKIYLSQKFLPNREKEGKLMVERR